MRRCRRIGVLGIVVLALICVAAATPAVASPVLRPSIVTAKRVAPGGTLKYVLTTVNVGDLTTNGSVSLNVMLPVGITGISVTSRFGPLSSWSCSDPSGASAIHCTVTEPIAPGAEAEPVLLKVAVGSGAAGLFTSTFRIAGGDASSVAAIATTNVSTTPDFGITAFDGSVIDQVGGAYTQAGGHPYEAATTFELGTFADSVGNIIADGGQVKTVRVDLPQGFVGNPTAQPTCPMDLFLAIDPGFNCPTATQVGSVALKIARDSDTTLDLGDKLNLYSLEPPPGVVASLGVLAPGGVPLFLDARVASGGGYHVQVSAPDTPQAIVLLGTTVTLWGVPADPLHNPKRGCRGPNSLYGCDSESATRAFVTNPTFCTPAGEGLRTELAVDSWANRGVFDRASFVSHIPPGYGLSNPLSESEWGAVQGPTGCGVVPFDASISVEPDNPLPDSPSGLEFGMSFPQDGLDSPTGIATAHMRRVEVTLPEGMTVSPSSADGLQACSDGQIGIGNDEPVGCPEASKIGTVTATTPLLDEPLTGGVYVGTQESDDPLSGRMFRIFIALENKQRGLLIKLGGEVRTVGDEKSGSGRVVTVFNNNPQAPISNIVVRLKGGSRAPLATPPSCGTKTTVAKLTSWAGQTVERTDDFTIDCPPGLGGFAPSFNAGAVSPLAGAFSPFVVAIDRPDRQQYIAGVSLEMPGGTIAKLKGVPLCGDGDANAGTCPVQTRVGTATVGAGPGLAPFYIRGPVSWTGPYKGAPYGLAVAVRAKAGPFDLGTVVVRQAIYVDPTDAHLTVVSDPLPVVLKGVPVRLRSVNVEIDRPGFTLNPTSCVPKIIGANFVSSLGATARQTITNRVSDCAELAYTPKLKLRITGKDQTTDGKHPGLKVTYTQPRHQANTRAIKVALPLSLALDPENAASDTLCEFEEGQKPDPKCPKSSIIGTAKATTPVLNRPLSGPVYFVKNVRIDKNTGRRIRTLPTLLMALRGEVALNVRINSSVSKAGKLVSTIPVVPDAPVTRFDLRLKGGKKGILVVNGNACRRSKAATIALAAHNGKKQTTNTSTNPPCRR
jgi:hypothetical protein